MKTICSSVFDPNPAIELTDLIKSDVATNIFSNLNDYEMQSNVLVSKLWKEKTIQTVVDIKYYLFTHFTKYISPKLPTPSYQNQIDQLIIIEKNCVEFTKLNNLLEIKSHSERFTDEIINIIKELKDIDLIKLKYFNTIEDINVEDLKNVIKNLKKLGLSIEDDVTDESSVDEFIEEEEVSGKIINSLIKLENTNNSVIKSLSFEKIYGLARIYKRLDKAYKIYENNDNHILELVNVCVDLILLGYHKKSQTIAENVSSDVSGRICESLIDESCTPQAVDFAADIEDNDVRAYAFTCIYNVLIADGYIDTVIEIIQKKCKNDPSQSYHFAYAYITVLEQEELKKAEEILTFIPELKDDLQDEEFVERIQQLQWFS